MLNPAIPPLLAGLGFGAAMVVTFFAWPEISLLALAFGLIGNLFLDRATRIAYAILARDEAIQKGMAADARQASAVDSGAVAEELF